MKRLTFYQRAANSVWVSVPPLTRRSLFNFLIFGTYHQLRYEEQVVADEWGGKTTVVSYEVKK